MATCKHCGKPSEEHHKAGDGQLRCPVASTYEAAEEPRQDRREPGTADGDMRYDGGDEPLPAPTNLKTRTQLL